MKTVITLMLKARTTIVVGGEGAVSTKVFKQLAGAIRYGGDNRYGTAASIATGLELNTNRVYVVSGLNFSDALAAGNLAAHCLSPIVMVGKDLPAETKTYLVNNKTAISEVIIVGGEGAISQILEDNIRDILR